MPDRDSKRSITGRVAWHINHSPKDALCDRMVETHGGQAPFCTASGCRPERNSGIGIVLWHNMVCCGKGIKLCGQ